MTSVSAKQERREGLFVYALAVALVAWTMESTNYPSDTWQYGTGLLTLFAAIVAWFFGGMMRTEPDPLW